jgi:galactokinase
MSIQDDVVLTFTERFGVPPTYVVQAPGRVNLIGEHTDYNEGFVLPMAIDRATWIALRPRADSKVVLHSLNHQASCEMDVLHLEKGKGWPEYPKGVAWALQQAGYSLTGWEGVTHCDVPLGSGLSSSASFELAVARAFACVSGFAWNAPDMAVIGQKAENAWVGVNCGIMDQMISAVGQEGYAVLIDCRDFTFKHMPLPTGTTVVIMDTSTRRGLVESAYNERRQQCEQVARFFGRRFLRDVSFAEYRAREAELDPIARRRARHVITENDRTVEAAGAMNDGNAVRLGELMNQSHDSLRDDFEVTNRELDIMVRLARQTRGCLGARMTGAGFGGCAVALVKSEAATDFMETVATQYRVESGLTPKLYACKPSQGASVDGTRATVG